LQLFHYRSFFRKIALKNREPERALQILRKFTRTLRA